MVRTYEGVACGDVSIGRVGPPQRTNRKEEYANAGFANIDEHTPAKSVDSQTEDNDTQEVTAAKGGKSEVVVGTESTIAVCSGQGRTYERISVPRNGSDKPAIEKKSTYLAGRPRERHEKHIQVE